MTNFDTTSQIRELQQKMQSSLSTGKLLQERQSLIAQHDKWLQEMQSSLSIGKLSQEVQSFTAQHDKWLSQIKDQRQQVILPLQREKMLGKTDIQVTAWLHEYTDYLEETYKERADRLEKECVELKAELKELKAKLKAKEKQAAKDEEVIKQIAIDEHMGKARNARHAKSRQSKQQAIEHYEREHKETGISKEQFSIEHHEEYEVSKKTMRNNWLQGYEKKINKSS